LRVLIHHRIASFDGQAIHLSKLAAALRARGCEVLIVGPPVVKRVSPGRVLPLVDALRRSLPRGIYEAVELSYSGIAFVRLVWAWFRCRPDVLYERLNLFQPAGLWLRRLTGIPLLVEVNAPLFEERDGHAPIHFRRLGKWSEGSVLAGADRVLAVSWSLARLLESVGVPAERIAVVSNGADLPAVPSGAGEKTRELFGVGNRVVIGFLGFVRAWNRLDWAANLVGQEGDTHDLHLLVIGNGEGAARVTGRLNDRVTVTGAVEPGRVPELLAAVDIAVHPGVTDYASPIKVFEYMAQGLAIVAPDRPNIREILDHECAALFEPDNPAAFDAAVLQLCKDPERRRSLGSAARARLLDLDLTWDRAAGQVRAIALEVIAAKSALGMKADPKD
jgi:glycosyltransferase involved in cell wall biosynthesis